MAIQADKKKPLPSSISLETSKLVWCMLEKVPAKRPSIVEILKNPLIWHRVTLITNLDIFGEIIGKHISN
jgi:serine/threonine protein kinase